MKVAILIDYDNLQPLQKTGGVLDVVTKVLMLIPKHGGQPRGTCHVRIYGGWYEGELMSQLGQSISVKLQAEFPTVCRITTSPGNVVSLTTQAELALGLLEEPGHNLVDTYRRKGKPANVRVQRPDDVSCSHNSCLLPLMKKLLQNGKCPVEGCQSAAENLVYRHEQKIVDAMLTCDLLYIAEQDYDHLVLVSGDDDFLPPIRTLILRGKEIFRVHPQPNKRRTPLVRGNGHLVELEL